MVELANLVLAPESRHDSGHGVLPGNCGIIATRQPMGDERREIFGIGLLIAPMSIREQHVFDEKIAT